MPWKECHVVDERGRFVRRLLDGETMAALCAEFCISRKTGYKIFQRYHQIGVRGLSDRNLLPCRYANQLPQAVATLIVRLKKDHPTWGAPNIRERLRQRWPDIPCPAISTVHAVQHCRDRCAALDVPLKRQIGRRDGRESDSGESEDKGSRRDELRLDVSVFAWPELLDAREDATDIERRCH